MYREKAATYNIYESLTSFFPLLHICAWERKLEELNSYIKVVLSLDTFGEYQIDTFLCTHKKGITYLLLENNC